MWITLRDLILGIDRDPRIVAAVRGLLLIGLPIGVEALIATLSGWGIAHPAFVGLTTATAVLCRAIGEAALDYLKMQKFGIANGADR